MCFRYASPTSAILKTLSSPFRQVSRSIAATRLLKMLKTNCLAKVMIEVVVLAVTAYLSLLSGDVVGHSMSNKRSAVLETTQRGRELTQLPKSEAPQLEYRDILEISSS